MNLCADIGNSRLKTGIFRGHTLLEHLVFTDWSVSDLVKLGKRHGVNALIFSSVAQPDPELAGILSEHFPVLELDTTTPLPFENRYGTPHTLGKDRLAAVAGAQALFPGENCLVIDCGTCIKYDLISADNVYHGGNIAPGVNMRIQAMHHFTARLPQVPLIIPADFCGNSTETALQNGGVRGACLEIEGFTALFAARFTPLRVVLTGGDAGLLGPELRIDHLTEEAELTLHGLNNILNFNKKTQV